MQYLFVSCVQTELFGSLSLCLALCLFVIQLAYIPASFHRFIITSLTSSPYFTSFVASTGYDALFPLSSLLFSSRSKLSLGISHFSPRIAEAISHLYFIAAEREAIGSRRCEAESPSHAVRHPKTLYPDYNSPLCESAFEHQTESLFMENYLHRGIQYL